MTTPPDHQPPTFRQGPRAFCSLPQATLKIPSPGPRPSKPELHMESVLIPLSVMLAGAIMSIALINAGPFVLVGILMALGGAVVTMTGYRRQSRQFQDSVTLRQQLFAAKLTEQQELAERLRSQTRDCLLQNNPNIADCLQLAVSRDPTRLWSRLANDDDFLSVRLGLGGLPFQVKFELPPPMNALVKDPLEEQAEKLAERFRTIDNVPVLLDMRAAGVCGLVGEREQAVAAARVIALQLATHHSPDILRLGALFAGEALEQWAWLRWLPHVWQPDRQLRYLAADPAATQQVVDDLAGILRQRDNQLQGLRGKADEYEWPTYYVVFIADAAALNPETRRLLTMRGPQLGFHPVFLAGREAELPRECGAVIMPGAPSVLKFRSGQRDNLTYVADAVAPEKADEFSRLLAPLRFESSGRAIPNLVSLFDLLGLKRVEDWKVLDVWRANDPVKSLNIPIGIGAGGRPVMFDIHDDAHGPHGVAAGTAGSGKTRFLECLVAILAAHYHPHELGFMLIDFKGSDFLQELPALPHCVSVLSSIEGKSESEQSWYAIRALKALQAEKERRQRLFAAVGVSKISEYHQRQRQDPDRLRPTPRLIIIVDEFAELAAQQPDFLAGLVSLARVGRSLGMHLLLATQQPAGIVTDQIWANSRFRLSMKFNKTEDSQAVLKRPDAAYIEQRGRGYLQVGENELFELFQGPYGGIPYEEAAPALLAKSRDQEVIEIGINGSRRLHLKREEPKPGNTQLRALVQHIRRAAEADGIEPTPNLLPEDTDNLRALDDIRGPQGWNESGWAPGESWLQPAIGVLDDPTGQLAARFNGVPLLRPDLERFGHLFVCCDVADNTRLPLRSLITSLACDHSPADLSFYALDFGNNAMSALRELPHVGAVIHVSEVRRITRLIRWLFDELAERRELLAGYGLTWARARRQGIDLGRPAIVLVVDNLIKWKDEIDHKNELAALINEGAPNGIHLILAGEAQAATVFDSILGGVSPRLALGFADKRAFRDIIASMPYDQNILGGIPEWGVYYDMDIRAIECRVVAPVRAGSPDEQEKELRALAHRMRLTAEQLGLPRPHPIGDLPLKLPMAELSAGQVRRAWDEWTQGRSLRAPLGLDDQSLTPLEVDLSRDGPHFLILGPPRSGKTTTLHTWLLSLAARVPRAGVRFVLFDAPHHSLQPLASLPQVERVIAGPDEIKVLFGELGARLGGYDAPAFDPPVVWVFDDLHLFKDPNLRKELAGFITQARGLHVLATGRTNDLTQYAELEQALLKNSLGLLVGSHRVETEGIFFGVSLPSDISRGKLPPGRGYLLHQGEHSLVQVSMPPDAAAVARYVAQIAAAHETAAGAEMEIGSVAERRVMPTAGR